VKSHSSLLLAEWLGGTHHGPELQWSGLATLETATDTDVSFAATTNAVSSNACVLLLNEAVSNRTCVVVPDPKLAFIKLIDRLFHVEQSAGIDPAASIDPSAFIHATATIHAGVVVMERCHIAAHSVLFPNVVLYPNTRIGEHCRIHAGTVIGADGFSYHPTAEGLIKVPQVGRVIIENGVEIGANSTVDRSFLTETIVGAGSKIDNQVHIGHNARLGSNVVIAAQSGISGSVTIGNDVFMGGQVGVVEHTTIGDGAKIGAQSGVTRDVGDNESVLGTPAEPAMQMKRIYAALRKLPDWMKKS
jgi:UDP-3-O-[3-hydroxymyristoyl] glucosamine N-acyltransferase